MKLNRQRILFAWFTVFLWVVFSLFAVIRLQENPNDFDVCHQVWGSAHNNSEVGLTLFPYVSICVFNAFSFLPLQTAAALWIGLFLVLSFFLTFKILNIHSNTLAFFFQNSSKATLVLFLWVGCLFLVNDLGAFQQLNPDTMVQVNAIVQVYILVFYLGVASVLFWGEGKKFLSGAAFSAGSFLKLSPLLFCLYFITGKSWQVLLAAAFICFAFGFVIPVLLFDEQKADDKIKTS